MALRATRAVLSKIIFPIQHESTRQTRPIKATILEVERKFPRLAVPTLTDLHHSNPHHHRLPTQTQKYCNPLFSSVLALPTRTIHDMYYDTPCHTLCAAGAWVRLRNGVWQAKIKRGGDFVNSRFEELCGEQEVAGCVSAILGTGQQARRDVGAGGLHNFGLGKLAEFVTTREAWLVDGEFAVVRDRMDFGHEVGEVELQVEREGGMGEGEKSVLMEEMDRRIEGFMGRYKWAWEEGEAVGKLTAYFEMAKRGERRR